MRFVSCQLKKPAINMMFQKILTQLSCARNRVIFYSIFTAIMLIGVMLLVPRSVDLYFRLFP